MFVPTSKIRIAKQLKTKQAFCSKCNARTTHNFKYEMHQPKLFFLSGKFELKKITKRCVACNTETVLEGKAFEKEKKVYKLPEKLR